MRTALLVLALSATVLAQAPPSPHPIAGRLVRFGYDKAYPTIPGDLIGVAGQPSTAVDNGVVVALPSRNVSLDCSAGVYRAEVWSQPAQQWKATVWSVTHSAYYPVDLGAHTWLTCPPTSDADVIELTAPGAMGVLRCHGYDGSLQVSGDLQPGVNNGVLFSLWAKNAHIIKAARVYHVTVHLGSFGWNEAVYSVDLCDFDPQ